jgi:phage terminase large subunit-like protein
VRKLFGWKRPDGTRRYRKLWLEVARKNGKTEFAAALALLLFVADGEMGAQIYSLATDKEQARIVFDKAARWCRWRRRSYPKASRS